MSLRTLIILFGWLLFFESVCNLFFFHIWGILLCWCERLKMLVRYSSPSGPRCLRWRLNILSGPIALEDLACFIASLVSDAVIIVAPDVVFLCDSLKMVLVSLELVCLETDVYCLLKLFTIFDAVDRYFPLNLIPWFCLLCGCPLRRLSRLKSLEGSVFLFMFPTSSPFFLFMFVY